MRLRPLPNNTAPLLAGVIFLILSLVGQGGSGWASNAQEPLKIQQGRVTGTVLQLPLQIILEQLQSELGLTYKASEGELEKLVSVDLKEEPLEQALAKILATWDYALQMDRAGKILQVFVVGKIQAGGLEGKTMVTEKRRQNSSIYAGGDQSTDKPLREQHNALKKERSIKTSPYGTLLPVIPQASPQQEAKDPQDSLSEADMEIIPSTGYPEMEVKRPSEEDQRRFNSQFLNQQAIGNKTMNIAPVSEERAREILRSFKQPKTNSTKSFRP